MVRHDRKKGTAVDGLLDFHFSPPPRQQQSQSRRGPNNPGHQNQRRNQPKKGNHRNNKPSPKKHSFALFYSANHVFFLTRGTSRLPNQSPYSYRGPDEPVSWDSVKMVQQFQPSEISLGKGVSSFHDCCPICLDHFICPRITKCGHVFCLACLLRHVHSYSAQNPYNHVKCPCCGLPVMIPDTRPLLFKRVTPPRLEKTHKFVKLYRCKECPTPFLPQPIYPRHVAPHAAPCSTDPDASYSRFLYIDPGVYQRHLQENQTELGTVVSSGGHFDETERLFLTMALDVVQGELQKAAQDMPKEIEHMERFANPSSGIYQPQHAPPIFATSELPQAIHDGSIESKQAPLDAHDGKIRARRDSVGSEASRGEHSMSSDTSASSRQLHGGTMYAGPEEICFYQSADGQLCFLSSFNLNCLQSDFSAKPSDSDGGRLPPLPDVIEGKVVEVTACHLDFETRKRCRFLSHLALFLDVYFVELDLRRYLSSQTRQKFKTEEARRKKRRQQKIFQEKRADRLAQQKEQELIDERKSRLLVDPNDEFFMVRQAASLPETPSMGEDFGPSIAASNNRSTAQDDWVASEIAASPTTMSFSAVTRSGGAFPELGFPTTIQESFPALSSQSARKPQQSKHGQTEMWGAAKTNASKSADESKGSAVESPPEVSPGSYSKKKKAKGKKVVLFSTGGQRGQSY